MSGRDTSRSEAPLTGPCHCGNLELALETSLRSEELLAPRGHRSSRIATRSSARRAGSRVVSFMERVPRVEEIDV